MLYLGPAHPVTKSAKSKNRVHSVGGGGRAQHRYILMMNLKSSRIIESKMRQRLKMYTDTWQINIVINRCEAF
jgi:hypothetical protein